MRRRTRWILLVFGALVAVWLLWVGARVTDRSEFCASCHFMQPFVENWASSSHAGVRCIDCHYEEGFEGYLAGKARLIAEMLRYWAGAYNVRPHARMPDANCLNCHPEKALETAIAYKQKIQFSHKTHYGESARSMGLVCNSCHSELVQGSHTAVDEKACITCHFVGLPGGEPLGSCQGCHGPPQDTILVDSIVFNHSDYLKSGVDCLSCHVHVTRGTGDVPPQMCYACHVERFAQYGNIELVHRVHVTDQQLKCTDCHTDLEHGKFDLTQALAPDCRICHGGRHSAQEQIYIGTGGQGITPSPDPMFLSGVTCSGCHRFPVQSPEAATPAAKPEACVTCHGSGYDRLLENWQRSIRDYLSALRADLARFETLSAISDVQSPSRQVPQEAREFYERAAQNLALVENDASVGAHNIHYINSLLRRAEVDIQAIQSLLVGQPIDASEASLFRSRFDCTRCHEGIERETVSTPRAPFPHGVHLEGGYDCDICHGIGRDDHGTTAREALGCATCHPTAEQIRRMKPTDCLRCHEAEPPLPTEQIRFPHAQHTVYGCGFCHSSVVDLDHLVYLQEKKQAGFDHKTCGTCHARDVPPTGTNCGKCHLKF